jgi:hypothetical protein
LFPTVSLFNNTAKNWDLHAQRCLSMSFSYYDNGSAVVEMQKVLWSLRENFWEIWVLSSHPRSGDMTTEKWNAKWPCSTLLRVLGHRILPYDQKFDWVLMLVDL